MKKLFILLCAFGLAACSSGGSSSPGAGGGGGVVTEFGRKLAGEWTSQCLRDDQGQNYRDVLTVNANGTGQSTTQVYANPNCNGNVAKTEEPSSFTYTSADQPNGATIVTITQAGKTAQFEIEMNGNLMELRVQGQTIQYTRTNQVVAPQEPIGNAQDSFDRLARGNWLTVDCFTYQNNTTAKQMISILGHGAAESALQIYQSQNCTGNFRAERTNRMTYVVNQFANGQGTVTVNNEVQSVSFQNNRMIFTIPGQQPVAYDRKN